MARSPLPTPSHRSHAGDSLHEVRGHEVHRRLPGDYYFRQDTTETISIAAERYDERYPDATYLAEVNRYVSVWNDYGTPQDVYDRLVKPNGNLDGDVNVITIQRGSDAHIALDGSGGAMVIYGRYNLGNVGDIYGRTIDQDGEPVGDRLHLDEPGQQRHFIDLAQKTTLSA